MTRRLMEMTVRFLFLICAFVAAISGRAEAQGVARAASQPLPTTLNKVVGTPLFEQQGVASFYVSGLTGTGAVLSVEGSNDAKSPTDSSKTWVPLTAIPLSCPATPFATLTTDQAFKVDVGALTDVRVRVSTAGNGNIALVSFMAIPGVSLSSLGCKPTGGGIYQIATAYSSTGITGLTTGVPSGSYLESCTATSWNGASAQIQSLGPDGVTYLTGSVPPMTVNGVQTITVGAGATIEMNVTGTAPTNLNCNISANGG